MLPPFALLAPPVPSGTTTTTVLGDWLTQATGVRHTIAGELRDYPVFVGVRSGGPPRVEALVATALAGEWTQDGSTLRLVPVRPKPDEGLPEFEREWRAATLAKPDFAALPAREISTMRAGEILRFGSTEGPYVRPLPSALRKKADAGEWRTGWVYVRRFTKGVFETKVEMPDERKGASSGDSQIEFHSLPPQVVAALGDEARRPALTEAEIQAIQKLTSNISAAKVDPKSLDATDPLARFVDPVLRPLAAALKEDLVVALPDFAIMGLMGSGQTTVGAIMRAFCQFDDWTIAPGAFVGRLPVAERRERAQTRRAVMADFIRSTQDVGVPGSAAVAAYLAGQRPAASEGWTDAMMLVMSGVVVDETHVGDYPFNLRLAAALTSADWARLRTGRPLTLEELSVEARAALLTLLVQSRERMGSDGPDPVRWRGFPNVPLTIAATVEEEPIVVGFSHGMTTVAKPEDAGYAYRKAKTTLGSEPLYRPGRRRKLTLTVANPAEGAPLETGFADVSFEKDAKSAPWTSLAPEWRKPFEERMKLKDAQEPSPAGTTP